MHNLELEVAAIEPEGRLRDNVLIGDERKKRRAVILLLISLALIALGGVGACLVQTDGGKIQVTGFTLPTENGQWITADLFKPKTATAENPVPMVLICPGFERSKETMTSYSIELARRGIAVITIDPYNQGASSSTRQKRSATLEGYGIVPMEQYVHNSTNFNYVDKSRVGAAGYSAGGNAVLQSASRLGARQAKASKHSLAKDRNRLSAIFIGGYVLTLTDEVLATLDANCALDYARYDEGAFRTERGNADLREAPEALRFVNSVLPKDKQVTMVEIGKNYGDYTSHTMRVVHNTKGIHPLMPYDKTHIAGMIDFFTTVFDLNPSIPSTNQIWPFKELFTLIALAGGFLLPVSLAPILIRLPAFKSVTHPVPQALPAPGTRAKILFAATFIVLVCTACFSFIPLARATAVLFPDASASKQTWWFPERINNAILLWAAANGTINLIIFFTTYKLFGKKNGVTPAMWGIKTNLNELAKTLCLALILTAAFYIMLFASYGVFHTDFRFTFVSAATSFPWKMLIVAMEYIPLFFIFYIANSIRVNGANRFEGQKEWVSLLISALGNSVGLLMILAIQYVHLALAGTVYWTQEWLYSNLLFGVTPMMFILPYFNRYFFRITGKVYLGAMVTCLVFILMMLTSNVCYIPLK